MALNCTPFAEGCREAVPASGGVTVPTVSESMPTRADGHGVI
jgi:hypothetical protein